MEIGALRELSRLRRPRAVLEKRLENPPRDEHAAVPGNLHHILAGVAGRRAEDREQHVIELLRSVVDRPEMLHAQ